MKYVLFCLIGYLVLYSVVWLHEIGHSVWMYAHGKIVSYMFIGSIYLVSDMANIHAQMPFLRLPNFLVGALMAVLYVNLLMKVPADFRWFLVIYNLITVVSMCMGRIIFTAKARNAAAQEE